MEIYPVRTEEDYERAMKEIDALLDSEPGTPEFDRLDVISTLVWAYEEEHYPIPEPDDPVEVIEFFMDAKGLTRKDLVKYLGSKERVSEFFNRKRGLSLGMIRRLHEGLGIPPEWLIGKTGDKERKSKISYQPPTVNAQPAIVSEKNAKYKTKKETKPKEKKP